MEKVIEAIENATDSAEAVWVAFDRPIGVLPDGYISDLKALLTEYQRTKKALELANEGLSHYSEEKRWNYGFGGNYDGKRLYIVQPLSVNGYDKARETQQEIEKLLGGGE